MHHSSIAAFFSMSCQSRAIFVNVLLLAVGVKAQRAGVCARPASPRTENVQHFTEKITFMKS